MKLMCWTIDPARLAPRSVFRIGLHRGQISDLRRAFGMPSVFN